MGNCVANDYCKSCGNNPGSEALEFVIGSKKEKFQDESTPMQQLDRYESFYRVVCNPLTQIKAKYFITDVNFLLNKVNMDYEHMGFKNRDKALEKNIGMIKHSVELIPLKMFIDHFSQQYIWQKTFQEDSAFKKLLQIPDLITVQNFEKFEFAKNIQDDWGGPMTIGSSAQNGSRLENNLTG